MKKPTSHLDKSAMVVATGAEIRFGVREGLGNAYPEIKPIRGEHDKGSGELPHGFTQRIWDSLTAEQKKLVVYGGRKAVEDIILLNS